MSLALRFLSLASISGAALLAACGSDVTASTGSGGAGSTGATGSQATGATGSQSTGSQSTGATGSSSTSTGSVTTTSTGTGGGAPGCPPDLPSAGTTCSGSQIGLVCEYGDDPRPYCRDFAACEPGEGIEPVWTVKLPDCPPIAPPADCPPAPDPNPKACAIEGELCLYPDGAQCGCSSCGGGPCGQDPYWYCSSAPAPGCGTSAPNTGQPCGQDGLVCSFGTCASGTIVQRTCTAGVWNDQPVPCPE